MRIVRALGVVSLVALVVVLGSSGGRAQVPSSVIVGTGGTSFHGVGDLAGGGANSIVQEATQVGGTVYAVGASTQTATNAPIPNLDTAVVWDSGSNALTVIPALVTFGTAPTNANSNGFAITPDAQFIAARLRSNSTAPSVSTGTMVPRTSLTTARTIEAFGAMDISDDGHILYGQQNVDSEPPNMSVNNVRAVRVDVSGPANARVQVPHLTTNLLGGCVVAGTNPSPAPPQTCSDSIPANRGMSGDGSVLVGTAFKSNFNFPQALFQYQTTNGLAWRWEFNDAAVTEIPRPTGGTWSSAIAISPDGNLTLAGGNSTNYPLGQVWIHNATTGTIEELGSPNTAFFPRLWGGLTADGAVVGVTFTSGSPLQNAGFNNNPVQYAYLHNSSGWFHLANVLTAQGVDLWGTAASPGWDPANMILTGIRTVDTDNNGTADVDLVFGQGRRRNANGTAGAPEGFVASFPVGVLAAYQPPAPAPVANRSLVGAWAIGPDANNPLSVLVFTTEGNYYSIPKSVLDIGIVGVEFERGVYTLTAANALTFTTTKDRDGAGPPQSGTTPATYVFNGFVSSLNGRQSLSANFTSADTFVVEDATCSTVCSVVQGTRIAGGTGSIVGAWTVTNPPWLNGTFVAVFRNDSAGSKYFMAGDGLAEGDNGSETGTYTFDAGPPHQLILTPIGGSPDTNTATLTSDGLGLVNQDANGSTTLTRIVNPETVLPSITNATLAAGGAEDSAFSYTVTALNGLTFSAEDLPAGLTLDPDTGEISGTPAVNGTFNVTVTVTNTFGDTDSATLVLTVAPPPAGFHGIGDLPTGAVGSAVRDATRVTGTLYAVGASTANDIVFCTSLNPNLPAGCLLVGSTIPNLDTPALWTYSGAGGGTIEALPHDVGVVNTNTTSRSSYAITRDGTYLSGQSQPVGSTGTNWVRVTRSLLPASAANLNLNLGTGAGAFVNLAMSEFGTIHYGQRQTNAGTPGETRVPVHVTVGGGAAVFPDLTPTGKTWGVPIPRGTSSDGNIMVGMASNGPVVLANAPVPPSGAVVANTQAFRYSYNPPTLTGSTSVIPFLTDGGTWNMPVALTGTGSQTVVIGNSNTHPNGEVYLTNASNVVTDTLGSPNQALTPRPLGGMTNDGVIAITFAAGTGFGPGQISGLGIPTGNRYAYIRNSHGWFQFSSVLAAQGIDLPAMGWDPTNMAITGVRTVENMDLVFGQGRRRSIGVTNPATGAIGYVNGAVEGFVVELPAGVLAAFNPTPTPPVDESIIGAWALGADPNNPTAIITFLADGTFYFISTAALGTPQAGFETGVYDWAGNSAGGTIVYTHRFDTNGTAGLSGVNGFLSRTLIVSGNTATPGDSNCVGCTPGLPLTRIHGSTGSIVGGWNVHSPDLPGFTTVAIFLDSPSLRFVFANDEGPATAGSGVELGTYSWDAIQGLLTITPDGGVPDDPDTIALARDELTFTGLDDDGFTVFNGTRIIDPSLVQPAFVGGLSVSGTLGFAFSYTAATIYASSFSASGLPAGLDIDSSTGAITGIPTEAGSFPVTLTANNSFGGATQAILTIAINAPAVVVVPSGGGVTVAPEVPAGTPTVSLTFGNVGSGGGETTVAVIDPATTPELAPEPPGNFQIVLSSGGVPLYYDISTTAPITGPTTICFSYAGVDFGGQTPRLFHYVGGVWIDITTSVDEATQTLCGEATSFSAFAIFKSPAKFLSAKGFHSPVSSTPGFVNTAKGGSAVPLKFNLYVNGVEKTDVADVTFAVTSSICSAAAENTVALDTPGDSGLKYTGGHFHLNWKTPKEPGKCFTVRVSLAGTLLLSAKFKLK